MPPSPAGRLDGWKAIADHLGRTERTAQRWARERGMPVHHLPGGKGSTVFALVEELDAWRRTGDREDSSAGTVAGDAATVTPGRAYWKVAAALAAVIGVSAALAAWSLTPPADVAAAEVDGQHVIARTAGGRRVWSRPLTLSPVGGRSVEAKFFRADLTDLDGDGRRDVLAYSHVSVVGERLTIHRGRAGSSIVGARLDAMSAAGDTLWSWEPATVLSFAGRRFDGPWRWGATLTTAGSNGPRTFAALFHEPWWPSFIVAITPDGRQNLRYVQAGHVYALNLLARQGETLLLAAGVINEYAAASLAVLDVDGPAASSPHPPGSAYACDECPAGRPSRLLLFPPTEISRLSGTAYNRAHEVLVSPGTVTVSTWEDEDERAVYTLGHDLTVQHVMMSDRYWHRHRQLEREGRLTHSVEECPERRQGVPVRVWTASEGWTAATAPNGAVPVITRR